MSKEKKNMIVPELRFPQFKNSETWHENQLGKIALFFKGKGLPKNEITPDGKYPCIHYGELFTEYSEVIRIIKNRTNLEDCFTSNANDVLMPTSDVTPTGLAKASCVALDGVVLGGDILVIRTNSKLISGEFLSRYIRRKERDVLKLVSGSTVYHLYASAIEKLSVATPPNILEQQKIASCLSSLDDLITAHSQRFDALKAHKKGLMQQLFPVEGEKVPKLRFKEFKGNGEWKYSKIEDYIELLSGIPLKSEELCNDISGVPILRGINITEGYIRHSKDIDKYFLGDTEEIKKYLLLENDLVVAMDGSKVGKNVALIKREDEGSILIQRVARIRTNEKSDINYIYQHIFSENFRNYVDKVNTSSGIPHISSQQIKEFKIGFPSLKEQQKIAASLSSLDALITGQAEKIELLKLHKKGLMQGLFPKNRN